MNMQKMSNGDYFNEKMRRGDRSKEARRISPPNAPKSAHLHRGWEQGASAAPQKSQLDETTDMSKKNSFAWQTILGYW